MNRQEWEAQVFDSDLNPTARMVCLAIGSHANWTKEQTVWPTRQRIAAMVGTSRDNVGKYMTALEEDGWLKVVNVRKDNIREYELTAPQVAVSNGILSIKARGKSLNQVAVDNGQVAVDYDKQVAVDNGQVAVDYDSNLKNLPEEPTNETTSTDADAAVQGQEDSKDLSTTLDSPKGFVDRLDTDDSADAPSSVPLLKDDIDEWDHFYRQHPELEKPA